MTLLRPTTPMLMNAISGWPLQMGNAREDMLAWRTKNIPWVWTPEEYEEQTRALVELQCSSRDMVAWLVHGVQWRTQKNPQDAMQEFGQANDETSLDNTLRLWRQKGQYLRAWVEGTNAIVPEDALEAYSRQLDWHPHWRNHNLGATVQDFQWAHELRTTPSKLSSKRKPYTSFGSIELAHSTNDHGVHYACAHSLARSMRGPITTAGRMFSGAAELLASREREHLSMPFFRSLLVATLLNGDSSLVAPELCALAHAQWGRNLKHDEQTWWEEKARSLFMSTDDNETLLHLGIHPLLLIYREHAQELAIVRDLNPQTFCSGIGLKAVLGHHDSSTLALPELDGPDTV